MKDKGSKPKTISEFIGMFPSETRGILNTLRVTIKEIVPEAEEKISYGIPTFRLNEKNLIHFGGFKKHVSLFPGASGVAAFKKELSGYETSKGTIRFPIDKPLPWVLIKKIVKFKVRENLKGW